ncbi:MAG TPA: Ig-like domain-containing protein, partial [Thermoanaerobaculia bacterium]|nr:Ig-like domain-containing protein [Thermoanaerobaculia bacterium]
TGTDPDVGQVNMSSSTATTIAALRALTAPATLPSANRVAPTETTIYTINATLTQYKLESDSDYHLVLQDASGNTMIAEIPSPNCVGAGSPFGPGITNSRNEFDARYTATTSFQTANIPVAVKGVGFFDFLHGQTGVAPNGIELHAILDIVFNPSAADFSIGDSPSSLSVAAGSSGSSTVTTSISGSFNSAISLSASGLPSGATATFSPSSIAAPGSGSSTLTISTTSATAAGTYSVTITGTGGGLTRTAALSLTVTASGGGALANGGFETGTFSSWTTAGTAAVNTAAKHGGTYGAQLGSTAPSTDSTAAQTFTLPSNASALTFWYANTCPDTVTYDWATATLKDNVTGTTSTILAKTCTTTAAWTQVSTNVAGSAGHSVTLTLTNHDDNYAGDATYTYFDDVAVSTSSGDTTPPTTSITAPANGATVSGTVSVTASASDNVGVSKVEFYLDGALKTTDTASPYTWSWDTTASANGSHSLVTKAYDAAGNVGTSATVTVTVSNSTSSQLLGNPGFENGSSSPAPWTASSGAISNSTSEPPHGGTWDAWLCGYGSAHTDTLLQTVAIPSGKTTATLTFWLHIDTAETTTTTQYDTVKIQIRNSSGTVLATLATYSNLDHNTGYTQKSFNLNSYIGQTIQVYVVGTEDASYQTSFVVDDFALNVQ